jgi:hypothetical protein
MGTGWLFDVVDDMFTGAFTGAWTLLSGWLGSVIIFLLALWIVVLVYFVAKRFTWK